MMAKYLVIVNYGYGDDEEVIDVESQDEADSWAYETWKEGAEGQAKYMSKLLTPEVAEEYGYEDELEGEGK
jgi:hypothetical protein